MRHRLLLIFFIGVSCAATLASAGQRPPSPGTSPPPPQIPEPRTPPPRATSRDEVRKQAQAFHVASGSIRLDGRLDDEVWQNAVPITDFFQAEPVENAEPTNRMDVRFAYDDTALWVGARMQSSEAVQ